MKYVKIIEHKLLKSKLKTISYFTIFCLCNSLIFLYSYVLANSYKVKMNYESQLQQFVLITKQNKNLTKVSEKNITSLYKKYLIKKKAKKNKHKHKKIKYQSKQKLNSKSSVNKLPTINNNLNLQQSQVATNNVVSNLKPPKPVAKPKPIKQPTINKKPNVEDSINFIPNGNTGIKNKIYAPIFSNNKQINSQNKFIEQNIFQ